MRNKFYIGESINGKGVFAGRLFRNGEKIIEFQGQILKLQDLPNPYDAVEDHYVQIGEGLYMGPSGKEDDLINHSCDPNSGLVIEDGEVALVAIRDIKAGEEITWDYSTTMDEDDWEIDCHCRNRNCRQKIRDFKYLSEVIKEKYVQLGIVPVYNLKYVLQWIVKKK